MHEIYVLHINLNVSYCVSSLRADVTDISGAAQSDHNQKKKKNHNATLTNR